MGDVAVFHDDIVFRRPLVGRVEDLSRFGEPEGLWDDLLRRGTRQPAFRVVRDGSTVGRSDVTRRASIGSHRVADMVAPNQVIDRYRGGDTVVLQGLHHTDPRLARVANNLALALDHPVQINAYLSPASVRGLELHFDFHDVFIVQLHGLKRWRAWAPLERTTNPVKGQPAVASLELDELGNPLLDITMRAGDCLYLPRGYPHVAETVADESSHLTIGLVAVTWHRVLRHAIDAEVAAGRLRGALPALLLEPDCEMPTGPAELDALRSQLAPATLRHWLAREIWRRQAATRLRPRVVPALGSGPLVFTPGPLLWLTTVGDWAVLGLGDRLLELPDEAYDFLADLLEAECPVEPDTLKHLDDESRDVVLRRLHAEGVLAVVG